MDKSGILLGISVYFIIMAIQGPLKKWTEHSIKLNVAAFPHENPGGWYG